jgi:HAE1 family hydrophobic/amphiphilic exporter-1
MYALNFSIDNISLMALAIAVGFVVDDAIVVVENIYRHVEEGVPPFEAALKGSSEIAFTVLSISLSLIAVFIPLLLMGGIIGRVFREFALTVTAAILVSCVVSLTLAPMLCSRFMKRVPDEHGPLYRIIEQGFSAMLAGYRRTLSMSRCVTRPSRWACSSPPWRSRSTWRRLFPRGSFHPRTLA